MHLETKKIATIVDKSMRLLLPISIFCMPALAQAEKPIFCPSSEIPLEVQFHDVPVRLERHIMWSSINTVGLLNLSNESTKAIKEIDAQIEYYGQDEKNIGLLRYGATSVHPTHAYFEKLKHDLEPKASVTLHTMSLRVLTVCPRSAKLTAIRIRYADGSQLERELSSWMFEEFPHNMPGPLLPVGTISTKHPAYLLELTISSTGDVSEILDVKPDQEPLPAPLRNDIRLWRFHAQTRDGVSESSRMRVVVRILGPKGDAGVPISISRDDLLPSFVLIDLVPNSSNVPASAGFEAFEVYFSGIPFSGTSEIVW